MPGNTSIMLLFLLLLECPLAMAHQTIVWWSPPPPQLIPHPSTLLLPWCRTSTTFSSSVSISLLSSTLIRVWLMLPLLLGLRIRKDSRNLIWSQKIQDTSVWSRTESLLQDLEKGRRNLSLFKLIMNNNFINQSTLWNCTFMCFESHLHFGSFLITDLHRWVGA